MSPSKLLTLLTATAFSDKMQNDWGCPQSHHQCWLSLSGNKTERMDPKIHFPIFKTDFELFSKAHPSEPSHAHHRTGAQSSRGALVTPDQGPVFHLLAMSSSPHWNQSTHPCQSSILGIFFLFRNYSRSPFWVFPINAQMLFSTCLIFGKQTHLPRCSPCPVISNPDKSCLGDWTGCAARWQSMKEKIGFISSFKFPSGIIHPFSLWHSL